MEPEPRKEDTSEASGKRAAKEELKMEEKALYFWSKVFDELSEEGRGFQSEDRFLPMRQLKQYLDNATPEQLEVGSGLPRSFLLSYVKELDLDDDGRVSLSEWRRHVRKREGFRPRGRLGAALRVLAYAPVYSCSPPTLFMLGISLLQVANFYVTGPHNLAAMNSDDWWRSGFIYFPVKRHEVWRYLTVMFTHFDALHLFSNVLVQLIVGIPLEMSQPGYMGSVNVALVYSVGTVLGTLLSAISAPYQASVGASGGCFALIASHLAHLILNWKEDGNIYRKMKEINFAHFLNPAVRIFRLITVLAFLGMEIFLAIKSPLTSPDPKNPTVTAHLAHLGGALAGLLLGIFVLENRRVEQWEKRVKMIAFGALAIVFFALVAFTVVCTLLGIWFPPLIF